MKRSTFKNKANNSCKPADKKAYQKYRNLVVKLNKEAKYFLKNQITENTANKTKIFWNHIFSLKKVFIINRNSLLKLRGVTSGETTIANVFENYFVNITKSLNIFA